MTIYETPKYVIRGVQALDELIATHIYGDPEPYNKAAEWVLSQPRKEPW